MFKKIIVFYIATFMVFLPEYSFAQRHLNRSKKNSVKSTSSKPKNQTKEEEISLSCEEKYNLCMDNVCINQNGIRTDCDTSIDSFETIEKDGEKFRIGNDLYTFAKGVCVETLKSCPLAERNHIETVYKAKIKEDTLTKNYIDAMNASSDETLNSVLEEYVSCMQPLCGNNFTDCFTIKNVERRTSNCDEILKKTSKPLSVKKMFYTFMEEKRDELCKQSGGYVNYDTKICNIEVAYGSLEKLKDKDGNLYYSGRMSKKVASKTFKVGEIVECTQDYFATTNVDKPLLAKGLVDIVSGALKTVAGAVLVVVGVVGTIFSFGSASVETVPMIANGTSMMCKGTGSILNGAVKINTDVKVESGCFINGVFATGMGTYFKVNFLN